MAFQLASAYVELTNRGFSTVMGGIDGIRSKLGGLVRFATGPVAAGMAALGAGASIAGMVSLAAKVEQTTAQFKTLLGSADAAKGMIGDLQQFAASTPFQFDGLADSAKVLLAFGTSSEQVVPTLRVLGDVAAATGNQVGELANIYGKVRANGRLMTETLDQFNERAIPVGAKLAEMFGKTEGEIRKMASEGKISFGDLQRALGSMASQGGMAFNGMAEQSTTLGGLWSTFKDNATLLMGDIGSAIVEGFEIKNIVSNMTAFAGRFRSDWMPSIVSAFQWTRENIIGPWIEGMAHVGAAVGNLVAAVSSQFQRLTAGLQGSTGGFFSWLIGSFYGTYANIIDTVANFVADFDLYWQLAYTSLGNTLNNMWQLFTTGFSNAWIITKWFFGNFGTIAYNTVTNIGNIFVNYFKQIKNHWESLLNFFKTGKLEFDFTPMKDSLNAILEGVEMPKLEVPQLDALRGDMDRIESQLAKRQADRLNARNKIEKETAKEGEGARGAELAIVEDTTKQEEKKTKEKKDQTAELKKQAAGFVSLADLADQMQMRALEKRDSTPVAGMRDNAVANMRDNASSVSPAMNTADMLAALNRQVAAIETLLSLARESGIKIKSMGERVGPPASDWQFGSAGT